MLGCIALFLPLHKAQGWLLYLGTFLYILYLQCCVQYPCRTPCICRKSLNICQVEQSCNSTCSVVTCNQKPFGRSKVWHSSKTHSSHVNKYPMTGPRHSNDRILIWARKPPLQFLVPGFSEFPLLNLIEMKNNAVRKKKKNYEVKPFQCWVKVMVESQKAAYSMGSLDTRNRLWGTNAGFPAVCESLHLVQW